MLYATHPRCQHGAGRQSALDLYFVYEFHLTLFGSPRELAAQATKRPPDLYSVYEFHFTLLSSPYSEKLTAQGAERPFGLLLRVRVQPHAVWAQGTPWGSRPWL